MEMRVVSGMGQGGLLSRSSGAGVDNVVTGAATCGVWGHVPLCPAISISPYCGSLSRCSDLQPVKWDGITQKSVKTAIRLG